VKVKSVQFFDFIKDPLEKDIHNWRKMANSFNRGRTWG